MPRKISLDTIKQINEIYYKCKSYAETAREVNVSPATVRAYVDKNYTPEIERFIKRYDPNQTPVQNMDSRLLHTEKIGDLCELSKEEEQELFDMAIEFLY